MLGALVTSALGYQLAARRVDFRPPISVTAVAMETFTLNNYVLDGPPSPLDNQVLIKLNKVEDKTDGGLFVPNAQTERPKEGTVVSVGPGYYHPVTGTLIPNPFKPGDLVLLDEWKGEKVEYNREKHVFCDALDVLGKFAGASPVVAEFAPTADTVLVATAESATETTSGIALALDESDDDNKGEVVAVGEGKVSSEGAALPMSLSVGDNVLFAPNSAKEVTIDNKKYKLVSSPNCLAKW